MTIFDKIDKIKDNWFLTEPAYYIILTMQKIELTTKTNNISCGRGRIYINESFFSDKSLDEFEDYLKIECLRILLKHPYQRVPPDRKLAYISSNMLISSFVKFKHVKLMKKEDMDIYNGNMSYEDIYNELASRMKENKKRGSGKGNGGGGTSGKTDSSTFKNLGLKGDDTCQSDDDCDKNTQYWEEDAVGKELSDSIVERIKKTNQWGSIPNSMESYISVQNEPKFDYRSVIRMFRKDCISSCKTLTRMKPNRRFGYIQMGSKNGYKSNILLVMDTSGSMSDEEIGKYLALVGGFFRYGFNSVDVIQFDVRVYDETLQTFTKKPKFLKSVSRGGTDVGDIIDYVNNRSKKKYGGVVLCSDGEFGYDKNKWSDGIEGTNYLFCIDNKNSYEILKNKIDNRIKITYLETNVSNE